MRQNLKSVLMFTVACVASPCCTPFYVPILLALLTGTPAAIWITQHLGWVYGGLTLLSAVSFLLAIRWMRRPKPAQPTLLNPLDIPVLSTFSGEKSHVE